MVIIVHIPRLLLCKVVNLDIDVRTRVPVVTVECHNLYAGTCSPHVNVPVLALCVRVGSHCQLHV